MQEAPVKTIQADHFPELAEQHELSYFAEPLGLDEASLQDPHLRRRALSDLSEDDFVNGLIQLNERIRGMPEGTGGIEDGRVQAFKTPSLEDKEPLLRETIDVVKQIVDDPNRSDEEALQLAGLTVAGAVNMIHPFEGTGRTGRTALYIIEFGAERGRQMAAAEMYSILGGLAVFNVDRRAAVDPSPPRGVIDALGAYGAQANPETWKAMDRREAAAQMVRFFLDAMAGNITITTTRPEEVRQIERGVLAQLATYSAERVSGPIPNTRRRVRVSDETFQDVPVPAGEDIVTLYRRAYLGNSYAPNMPDKVPVGAHRVVAQRTSDVYDDSSPLVPIERVT